MPNLFAKVSECAQVQIQLDECKNSLKRLELKNGPDLLSDLPEDPQPSCPADKNVADTFLRRHVQYLLRLFDADQEEEESAHFDVRVAVKGSEVKILRAFVQGHHNFHSKVDAILTDMFKKVEERSEEELEAAFKSDYSGTFLRFLPSAQDIFWLLIIASCSGKIFLLKPFF